MDGGQPNGEYAPQSSCKIPRTTPHAYTTDAERSIWIHIMKIIYRRQHICHHKHYTVCNDDQRFLSKCNLT
jgi:hypothetical protein